MSPARKIVFIIVALPALLWVMYALLAHSVRFEHQAVINAIRSGSKTPDPKSVKAAVIDYENAVRTLPCNTTLLGDLLLLRAYQSDLALAQVEEGENDDAFDQMRESLGSYLGCSPRDGKAWLDLAVITTFREGFSARAQEAYNISADVAPGESWLAQKRLIFALRFNPLLSDKSRATAAKDIAVLERGHPNRMKAVQAEAEVDSVEALYAMFDVQ